MKNIIGKRKEWLKCTILASLFISYAVPTMAQEYKYPIQGTAQDQEEWKDNKIYNEGVYTFSDDTKFNVTNKNKRSVMELNEYPDVDSGEKFLVGIAAIDKDVKIDNSGHELTIKLSDYLPKKLNEKPEPYAYRAGMYIGKGKTMNITTNQVRISFHDEEQKKDRPANIYNLGTLQITGNVSMMPTRNGENGII